MAEFGLGLQPQIRQAVGSDAAAIAAVLGEAARWLAETGRPMWRRDEVTEERIRPDIELGHFWVALVDGRICGVFKFQLTDQQFWPDVDQADSAFIHRLAVRRELAGQGLSTAMVRWAAQRAQQLGRRWLRLDCAADRPTLRAIYERYGFDHHSDFQAGAWHVARYQLPLSASADPTQV